MDWTSRRKRGLEILGKRSLDRCVECFVFNNSRSPVGNQNGCTQSSSNQNFRRFRGLMFLACLSTHALSFCKAYNKRLGETNSLYLRENLNNSSSSFDQAVNTLQLAECDAKPQNHLGSKAITNRMFYCCVIIERASPRLGCRPCTISHWRC